MKGKIINGLSSSLKRPMAFFDIETTSADIETAEIVQISIIKVFPKGYGSLPITNLEYSAYIMPSGEIFQGAFDVHGITKEFLKENGAKKFSEHKGEILEIFDGADISGYNILQFDIPILENEFRRAGIKIDFSKYRVTDVFRLVSKVFNKSLTNMYEILTGNERPGDAHDAGADVRDTIIVMDMLANNYLGFDTDNWHWLSNEGKIKVDHAGKFTKENGIYFFNFGPDYGKSVNTNPALLEWMLKNNFPENTKMWCRRLLDMMYEKPDSEKHADENKTKI